MENVIICEHLSHRQLGDIHDVSQLPIPSNYRNKPSGLWVAADNSWSESGIPAEMGEPPPAYAYDVTINTENILIVDGSSEESFLQFCRAYLEKEGRWYNGIEDATDSSLSKHVLYIDWEKISRTYDGVIISPAVSHKLERLFEDKTSRGKCAPYEKIFESLRNWDCASGCIWNKNSILSVEPNADGTVEKLRRRYEENERRVPQYLPSSGRGSRCSL